MGGSGVIKRRGKRDRPTFGMMIYGATNHRSSPARDGRGRIASPDPDREPIVVRIDTVQA